MKEISAIFHQHFAARCGRGRLELNARHALFEQIDDIDDLVAIREECGENELRQAEFVIFV